MLIKAPSPGAESGVLLELFVGRALIYSEAARNSGRLLFNRESRGCEFEWMVGGVDEPLRHAAAGSRAGTEFGHYRLKRLLGAGGFGEVYKARDVEMDRVVAIKLLAAHYSQNDVFRRRLFREARAAGQLHEPHVVPVHRCGEIEGQLYIDMRFIDGADLHAVLNRQGPLEPARAVAIVRQVAAALDAAHGSEIVHRDVKPANILLTGDDFAYLVDFGLASAATDAALTSTNTTIGTFAYMAPERLSNGEVSHCTDTYALACVLYECLTGQPPYPVNDLPALITAHLTAPVPLPSRHRPHIPARFDDVIARGMAKDPRDRYGSAGEFAADAHNALTASHRQHADTILATTHAAAARPATDLATSRASSSPAPEAAGQTTPTPGELMATSWRTRAVLVSVAVVTAAVVAIAGVMIADHQSSSTTKSGSSSPPNSGSTRTFGQQIALPFSGLEGPNSVALDGAGNVYVISYAYGRVFMLRAGSNTQVELPFTGLHPGSLAVDGLGTVYVSDFVDMHHAYRLQAGSNTPVQLPFTVPVRSIALDAHGNIYGAGDHQVVELQAGSSTETRWPFTKLESIEGLAVDTAGNLYLAGYTNPTVPQGAVFELPAGSDQPVELPFVNLGAPYGVAVDSAGSIYVADMNKARVLKLPAGSNAPVELPFTNLFEPWGVAVDSVGDVYVADMGNNRVLELPVQ